MKGGRKKESSKAIQTAKQSNTTHPRQSLSHVYIHVYMYTNLMKSEVEMLASKKSLLLVAMASLYATCPRRLMRTAGLVGTRVTT